MKENYIDFYRGKDEEAFLSAWEAEHGKLSDEAIDDLYADIADAVDEAVKNGTHELGESFSYKNVKVGRSDFNTFHSLYIFEESN